MDTVISEGAAATVRALADRRHVRYAATALDAWAGQVTRLAGDDVQLDEIEQLLIALQRGGHLTRAQSLAIQVRYLREAKP
jgi:hypothetical protein